MRVLITGSRTWTNIPLIRQHILGLSIMYGDLLLVHGACPKGADKIADVTADLLSIPVERHPAPWAVHGKRAGFLRNAHMVSLGADLCLAYIHNDSPGATKCAELAEKAGIDTRRYESKTAPL